MNECIYLHSYQIPSTNENLWKVLKRLCCKSVDSDSCCLILQGKKVFWQKLHRSSSSLLFPHSVLPDSQTSLCTLCWAQICTIPQTCLMGGCFPCFSSLSLFFCPHWPIWALPGTAVAQRDSMMGLGGLLPSNRQQAGLCGSSGFM